MKKIFKNERNFKKNVLKKKTLKNCEKSFKKMQKKILNAKNNFKKNAKIILKNE